MKNWIDPLAATCMIALAVTTLPGCTPSPPPLPVATGCGPLVATVAGRFREPSGLTGINTTATLDDSGTSVDWKAVEEDEAAGTGTGLVIDGFGAVGAIPEVSPRKFKVTGNSDSGGHTITVTGTITGPPAPCTGTGGWVIRASDGATVGRGRWRVP